MDKRLDIVASLGLEIPALEANQEGQLRGGFRTFGGMMTATDANEDCDCECNLDCDCNCPPVNSNCWACPTSTVSPTATCTCTSLPDPSASPMAVRTSVGLSFLF